MDQPETVITVDDFAKLPKGPREIFLLSFSSRELMRLFESKTTPDSIRMSLDEPNFWVSKLRSDGVLLPDDILEMIKLWKMKTQTPVEFLISIYVHTDVVITYMVRFADRLKNYSVDFMKFDSTPKLEGLLKDLVSETEQYQKMLLSREDDLIALRLSGSLVGRRETRCGFFSVPGIRSGFRSALPTDSSLPEFLEKLACADFCIEQLAHTLEIDCFKTISNKINQIYTERRKLRTESDDDEELEPALPDIQDPSASFFLERYRFYLTLISRMAREGDLIEISDSLKCLIYRRGSELRVSTDNVLPEEAISILKLRKLSSYRDVTEYFKNSNYLEFKVAGKGVYVFGDDEDQSIEVDGHTIFVGSPTPSVENQDANKCCKWVRKSTATRPGSRCVKLRIKSDPYFCSQHSKAATKTDQIKRIKAEQK